MVLLPEPFGPMMACTSPLFTVRLTPLRISLSSIETCRFSISNIGVLIERVLPPGVIESPFSPNGIRILLGGTRTDSSDTIPKKQCDGSLSESRCALPPHARPSGPSVHRHRG